MTLNQLAMIFTGAIAGLAAAWTFVLFAPVLYVKIEYENEDSDPEAKNPAN